jgi:hypothetical protein
MMARGWSGGPAQLYPVFLISTSVTGRREADARLCWCLRNMAQIGGVANDVFVIEMLAKPLHISTGRAEVDSIAVIESAWPDSGELVPGMNSSTQTTLGLGRGAINKSLTDF